MSVVIISGGPGAGKTTLLDALAERGYTAYPEIPRLLIEQESSKENGILPWHDLPAFAALCYDAMRVQKQLAQSQPTVFLDRAIPDICAYLLGAEQAVPAEYWQESLEYHPQVFMCEPNSTTYQQDEVRPYAFEEALQIHQRLVNTYSELGYECIDVPMASIEQRVEFVLATLSVAG